MIFGRLVFARQGRARTLGDGLLGERLLLDRDGVGGDHGVFASSSWNTPGAISRRRHCLHSDHGPLQLDHRLSPWWCGWLPQGLPQLDNIAVVLCRVSTAHGQSVSVAASSIIMANRFLASSSCRLVISAILRSR